MNLVASIKHLLSFNDIVIVPDWGAFITNTVSASIDIETDVINPPTKQLAFNARLQSSDGLLIAHIANEKGITYKDAEWQIKVAVKHWHNKLSTNNTLELNDIGMFTNDEGVLVFKATKQSISAPSYFGLPSVSFTPIVETEVAAEKPQPSLVAEKESKFSWFNIAASILLVAVLGALVYTETYIEPLSLQNLNVLSISAGEKKVPASIKQAPISVKEIIGDDNTMSDDVLPIQVDDNTLVVSNQNIDEGYYVVLGSFKSERNANKLIRKHPKLALKIVKTDNGYNRVVLFATHKASTANSSLQFYQTKIQNGSWMFYNMH